MRLGNCSLTAATIAAAVALSASGCAVGLGAITSADPRVRGDGDYSSRSGGGIGASVGASLANTRVSPEGMPTAATYGWNLHGGVLAMINGVGGSLEWQHRYEEGDYAGGFGSMLRSKQVMAYGSYSPASGLGLDLGAGYIYGGKFGFGGRGNVADDSSASLASASASGVRAALRLNWQVIGAGGFGTEKVKVVNTYTGKSFLGSRTNLPLSTTLQLECAYAWVDVGAGVGLPDKAQTMSLSAALVFALF
jgi:hypothetical protein